MHILDQFSQLAVINRFEVGDEVVRPGHVLLCLGVKAGMNGFIRSLEQAVLAILYQFDALIAQVMGTATGNAGGRHHHGGGNIVFHLHLFGRDVVLAQLEGTPLGIAVKTDTQVGGDDIPVIEFQFVRRGTVDFINGQMLAPLVAPLGPVETLDKENQRQDAR